MFNPNRRSVDFVFLQSVANFALLQAVFHLGRMDDEYLLEGIS